MRKNIVWTVLCIIVTIALLGCGGESSGGSAPDTITITISGQSGTLQKLLLKVHIILKADWILI